MILDGVSFVSSIVGIGGGSHVMTPITFVMKHKLLRESKMVGSDI